MGRGIAVAFVLLAGLAPSALGGSSPPPPATPDWLAAEIVPVSIAPGANPPVPAVAMLSNGGVVAFAATPAGIVELAQRSSMTGTWSKTPAGLTADATTFIRPLAVSTATGHVIATWVAADGILRTQTRGTDGVWSAVEPLSAAGATNVDLEANAAGGAVAVWVQGNSLRARTRGAPGGAWVAEATIATATSPPVGADAAVSPNGVIDVAYVDGSTPRAAVGTLATNLWGVPSDLPGHPAGAGASQPHVMADDAEGASVVWLAFCDSRAASRAPGSTVWTAAVPSPVPNTCGGVDSYFLSAADMNGAGQALFAALQDTGPAPDFFAWARRAGSGTAWATGPYRRFPAAGDERYNGVAAAVVRNGRGHLATADSPGEFDDTATIKMRNVSATGTVRDGIIAGSAQAGNRVTQLHRIHAPIVAPPAGALDIHNQAMLEWVATLSNSSKRLRIALRPGRGLQVMRVLKGRAAGRIAGRVTLNQPARVTLTFTTRGGRLIGRVTRQVPGGTTLVRLPGSRPRPLSSFRVRVSAVNGGAKATRVSS